MVIRKHALEHAEGDDGLTMEELARLTVKSATQRPFLIDARDPAHYKIAA